MGAVCRRELSALRVAWRWPRIGSRAISYEVSEPFQNQGYASEAVAALVNELLSTAKVIRAEVLKGRAASMKVLERAGLTRTHHGAHGETWERTLPK